MLVVRIADDRLERSASDLTSRARIRVAAVECFADEGFDVPFRVIAARAGVSPGLITHHFGSKVALRAECDTEVLHRYHALKSGAVEQPSAYLFTFLAEPGEGMTLMVYMLRAIHAGGAAGGDFLDRLMDDARELMADSVSTGLVRPSRDEEARLRLLTYQSIGTLLVQFLRAPDQSPAGFYDWLQAGSSDWVLPMLEVATEGWLADSSTLDDYVRYRWEPPNEDIGDQSTPESP